LYNTSDHPNVASTMYYIAEQLSYLGQYQKALEAFQEVLSKRRKLDRYSKLKVVEVRKTRGRIKAK
jgi:tetratricopeptide (TPR) repeat protein